MAKITCGGMNDQESLAELLITLLCQHEHTVRRISFRLSRERSLGQYGKILAPPAFQGHIPYPVFRLLGHLLGVKRQKSLRATFFWLRGLESYMGFFWASD